MTTNLTTGVPGDQRATLSGYLGVAQAVGPVIGIVLLTALFTGVLDGYVGLALIMVALVVPFAFRTQGLVLRADERPPR